MGDSRQPADDEITVWIVEDSADFRDTIQEILEAEPRLICPKTFGSGEEFLSYLDQHFPPDVVLMDIGLPGMSGIEVVRRLRPVAPDTAVVMLTVHDDSDRIHQALSAGAADYLVKSASATKVVQAVFDVLRGGAAMSVRIARGVLSLLVPLDTPRGVHGLAEGEWDTPDGLAEGGTKQKIEEKMHLGVRGVETHLRRIYARLRGSARTAAVTKLLARKLVR